MIIRWSTYLTRQHRYVLGTVIIAGMSGAGVPAVVTAWTPQTIPMGETNQGMRLGFPTISSGA